MEDFIVSWLGSSLLTASRDILIVLTVFVFSILYFVTIGRDFIIPAFSALFLTELISIFVPQLEWVADFVSAPQYQINILVFAIVFLVLFFVFKNNGFFEPYTVPTGAEIVIFAISFAGLIIFFIGKMLPDNILESLSPLILILFTSDWAHLGWLTFPALAFLGISGKT
ncbi:hypothetical protein D6827_02480 [Candidatus Parcubacteria bacterium]|nr:MAG: hypothetical protein D6827_02480 [Candidatus Parcubacteria bacterium]